LLDDRYLSPIQSGVPSWVEGIGQDQVPAAPNVKNVHNLDRPRRTDSLAVDLAYPALAPAGARVALQLLGWSLASLLLFAAPARLVGL
jgi:hypothetical protein